MKKYIKFLFQYLSSSRYIKKGKCNGCGNCCRNILLYIEDDPITTQEQFEKVKEWEKHYHNFYISGKAENGSLLFTCRELDENNRCKIHSVNPRACRTYPFIAAPLDEGGFERFYKGRNSSKESFGIGLNLAKMIITTHNGTVKAENSQSGGAEFTIRFYKQVV